jgi:hypothetical protein
MDAKELIALIQLIESLAPTAVGLVKQLMQDLSGKTDDEVLAEGDAILANVQDKARKAQGN